MARRSQASRLASLDFVSYDMAEAGSASALFSRNGSACGIYVLEFENGEAYVGKTVNIVSRYASHRRRYGDLVRLRFAPCHPDDLDMFERQVIHHEEVKGRSLRNLSLTGLPGGVDDVAVSIADGRAAVLPWDRSRRETVLSVASGAKEARFWQLSSHRAYPEILALLGRYVHETIPDPVDTQGMWALTALPATSKGPTSRRLLTLSLGQLEVLYVTESQTSEDPSSISCVINLYNDGQGLRRSATSGRNGAERPRFAQASYNVEYRVIAMTCGSLHVADTALTDPKVLDAAYRLNVALLRQGSRMFVRYHNPDFASAVLRATEQYARTSGPTETR